MVVLEALSLQMPVLSEGDVNRAPFTGILTRINEPSTRPPNGSDGHCVLMPQAAAEKALPSLLGMGVNSAANLREHAKRLKIGIITNASIDGNDLIISGLLYDKDFPDEIQAIRDEKDHLGMSYELSNVDVEDPEADIWTLRSFVFTGAAILYKDAAAYQHTAIAAQAEASALEDPMSQKILDELDKIQQQLKSMQAAADEADATTEAEATAEEEAATEATKEAAADEEAAKSEEKDAAASMKAMTALMKAMGYHDDEEEAAEDDAAMMKHMMKAMLRGMTYPAGGFGGEHDDEAEDTALFKRLMRQGKMAAAASRGKQPVTPMMLAMQKQLKELSAAMGLITDTLKRQTGLLTDLTKNARNLSTDAHNGVNGGPVRRSMAATGEVWAGKFDDKALDAASKDLQEQMTALDAELDKQGITDPTIRMARKLDLSWNKPASSRN